MMRQHSGRAERSSWKVQNEIAVAHMEARRKFRDSCSCEKIRAILASEIAFQYRVLTKAHQIIRKPRPAAGFVVVLRLGAEKMRHSAWPRCIARTPRRKKRRHRDRARYADQRRHNKPHQDLRKERFHDCASSAWRQN